MKVFLGGTVNGSTWRDAIIPKLNIDYFNPVVANWSDEARERELLERQVCDFCLYVITPKQSGFYSLAEVVDDSYKRPERTIFCFLPNGDGKSFNQQELEMLAEIGRLVECNGGQWLHSLEVVVEVLNRSGTLI